MRDCNQKTHIYNAKPTQRNDQIARFCVEHLTLTQFSINPVRSREQTCPTSGNGDRTVYRDLSCLWQQARRLPDCFSATTQRSSMAPLFTLRRTFSSPPLPPN